MQTYLLIAVALLFGSFGQASDNPTSKVPKPATEAQQYGADDAAPILAGEFSTDKETGPVSIDQRYICCAKASTCEVFGVIHCPDSWTEVRCPCKSVSN